MNGSEEDGRTPEWVREHIALWLSMMFFGFAVLRIYFFARQPEVALQVARLVGPSQIAIGTAVVLLPLALAIFGLWLATDRRWTPIGLSLAAVAVAFAPLATWPLIGSLVAAYWLQGRWPGTSPMTKSALILAVALMAWIGVSTQRFLPVELVIVGEPGQPAESGNRVFGYVLSPDDGGRVVILRGGRVSMVPLERVLARQLCVDDLPWYAESVMSLVSPSSSDDTYPC